MASNPAIRDIRSSRSPENDAPQLLIEAIRELRGCRHPPFIYATNNRANGPLGDHRLATLGFVAGAVLRARRAAQAPSTLSLDEAMARAIEANRTILAARTARAADVAGIQTAGQRPNPELGFEVARETPHWAFTGTIPLEVSGKRQRRIDVANATLAVTDAETARIAADVRADVRRAYYQAVGAVLRLAATQELEAIQTRMRDAAQDRFQTGAAPRLEALQASLAGAGAERCSGGPRQRGTRRTQRAARLPADAAPTLVDPSSPARCQATAATQRVGRQR